VCGDGAAGFAGAVLISPAFASKMQFSVFTYIAIDFFSIFMPKRQFRMPFTSEMCTRDERYRKIMERNAAEHRLASARLLSEAAFSQARFLKGKNTARLSVLFLTAGHDLIVDTSASMRVFKRLEASDKEMIDYPEMHHSLSIEVGRAKVFCDIDRWINNRI
jgi:alpha-beta hydrolase superfamily lysophospholipase